MISFIQRQAAEEIVKKTRLKTSINAAKSLRKELRKKLAQSEEAKSKKLQALQEKMKSSGFAGLRMGKHKVQEAPVDVQLGEELSETLRAMKVRLQNHETRLYR